MTELFRTAQDQNKQEKHLAKLITDYYKTLYVERLGVRDSALLNRLITRRLNEEETMARPHIERIQRVLNYKFDSTKKVLILGGGTGAEFVQFSKTGADVYTVEPNEQAIEIMHVKCEMHHLNKERIYKGVAENLPFENEFFDVVSCYTVIEHVQNVEKTLQEAIRVMKPGGYLYLTTHDYRQCFEGHYKMHMPLFLPKWMIKVYLWLHKKPLAYLDTLQFVTSKQLRNTFKANGVLAMQLFFPFETFPMKHKRWSKIMLWMQDHLEIEYYQCWIARKI